MVCYRYLALLAVGLWACGDSAGNLGGAGTTSNVGGGGEAAGANGTGGTGLEPQDGAGGTGGSNAICGDGAVGGDEECDGEGETATCDDDCTLAICGDGYLNVAAGEDYDDGGLDENDCTIPARSLWCFQDEGTFTLSSPMALFPAVLGPGVVASVTPEPGSPQEDADCPSTPPLYALGAGQWNADMPGPKGRLYCDGDPRTPPSDTPVALPQSSLSAIECGDYLEFTAPTGPTVSLSFRHRSAIQGGVYWAIGVSLDNTDPYAFTMLGTGNSNDSFSEVTFDLTDRVTAAGGIRNRSVVYFRLYAWDLVGDSNWIVDSVAVGP